MCKQKLDGDLQELSPNACLNQANECHEDEAIHEQGQQCGAQARVIEIKIRMDMETFSRRRLTAQ